MEPRNEGLEHDVPFQRVLPQKLTWLAGKSACLNRRYMGVSKNRGKTTKRMVYNGKPYEQMDDLEGFPIIFGSTPTSSNGLQFVSFQPLVLWIMFITMTCG